MEQAKEIMQLRNDVNNLKEVVEKIAILLNKKLIKELYVEAENIEKGDYLEEEEFFKKHQIRIH
mgnify:CR=1 FL=1